MVMATKAMTYEEAFDSIKAIPDMKGVDATELSGHNDFAAVGITNAQLILWTGERGSQTGVYGNKIYKIISELPVAEMIQGRMAGSSLFAIFARPVSADSNRIIILSDSAGAGFTGALIGYINNEYLNELRSAILQTKEDGGTAVYLNMMNF